MHELLLAAVGIVVGLTTVLFGFGGGFVAVPVIAWADHGLGPEVLRVATATSLVVMVGNAVVATLATRRNVLEWLASRLRLLLCLMTGGVAGAIISTHIPGPWVRWGFVAYIAVTLVDLLLRRGFVTARPTPRGDDAPRDTALPATVGVPIGVIATVLGVGGSVMTVPALRRSGASMARATALANPLTLAIVTPALLLTLATARPVTAHARGMIGPVDLASAIALLVGAIPVIVALRRRPLAIPDRLHAVGYLVLLVMSALAVALT